MKSFRKETKKYPRFLHSVDGKDTGPSLRLGSYQASNWLYGSYPRVSNSHWLFFLTIHTIEPRDFCLFSTLLHFVRCCKKAILSGIHNAPDKSLGLFAYRNSKGYCPRECATGRFFRCCWISFWKSTTPLFLPKFWRIMKVNKQKAVMRWHN